MFDSTTSIHQGVLQLAHNVTDIIIEMLSDGNSTDNIPTSTLMSSKSSIGGMNDDDNQPPLFDPRRQTQTLFKVQLYVCTTLGLLLFFTFCFIRYKFPIFFSVRSYKNRKIRKLPNDMFSWIRILISINNDQLLQVIGLESYVFLCFFRMSIKILLSLSVLGLCILSPIRYLLIGSFDRDNSSVNFITKYITVFEPDKGKDENSEPIIYLAISTVFTYIFTIIIFYFLFKETNHIIKTRQRFLGSQRSITDRTIFIKNIPEKMCNENDLKRHIQELNVGKVDQINFVYDYSSLVKLFEKRDTIIQKLEILYSSVCGIDVNLFNSIDIQNVHLKIIETKTPPTNNDILYHPQQYDKNNEVIVTDAQNDEKYYILAINNDKYNKKNRSCFKINHSNKEQIESLARQVIKINEEITHLKETAEFKRMPLAFVTMDSVTDAQMAAQAVFSPKVFELITELAPAPLDVNWNNLLLDNKTVMFRKNIIEFIIIVFSCLLIIPIRYITSLLNVNAIRKMWKELGDYLIKHDKARTIVTGLLPTYLFTLINVVLPYVISSLSNLQGLGSEGDVEISVIKKNFLYIFFNLFLVFTLFGTLSSYKALLTDTTQIAPLLATSIKSLSLFYIDLILLQGLTMFPFKLLQIGDLFILFWNFVLNFKRRTPRKFREFLFKPPVFDLGLILPQHILIFIITILYSSISTKILVSGLVYFILGFYTYKYQLVYSLVHPYHSTGKAWPIIFKRICLGVFFLHLQIFGSLALEQSFILAGLMLPVFPVTLIALMFFNKNYEPLLNYIALDAIKTHGKSVEPEFSDNGIDGYFLGSGLPSSDQTVNRKNSVVSLNRFFNGDEGCDAVLLNSSNDNLPELDLLENAIDDGDAIAESAEINTSLIDDQGINGNIPTLSTTTMEGQSTQPITITSRITMNNKSHRKCSTIEEEREAMQSYVHPCLLEKLDGIIIGFDKDMVDYLNFKVVNTTGNLENNDTDNNMEYGITISGVNGNNDQPMNEQNNVDVDLEVASGNLMGYINSKQVIDEIW